MLKRQHIELLYLLSVKELKDRYKSSYMGLAWMLLIPFVTMFTFYIIFKYFVPMNIANYPLYLMAGLIPWFFISFSVNQGVYVMSNNANLIKKIAFPKILLPFSISAINTFNYLLSLLILIGLILFSKPSLLSLNLLFLPLLIIATFVFCACLSIILGYLYIFYRDLGPIAELFLFILFYATPIFWTLDIIPEPYNSLIYLNPLVIFIELHHDILLNTHAVSLQKFLVLLAWTFSVLICAYVTHRSKNPILADYVR